MAVLATTIAKREPGNKYSSLKCVNRTDVNIFKFNGRGVAALRISVNVPLWVLFPVIN